MRRDSWLVPALLLIGCGSSTDSGSVQPEPNWVGANGIRITQVAIYQGPKRVLMQDGAQVPAGVPLVAGRPAFVRLFHATDAAYNGQPVLARLELGDGTQIQAQIGPLAPETQEHDLGSGAGFLLTGEQVGSTLDYSVALLQEGPPEAENPAARWSESVPIEGRKNRLRIVIVPYQYNADGSGRLPNTSDEQLQIIKNRFLGMYPVSDVQLEVHEPVPWGQAISPNGNGWQAVGMNLFSLRNAAVSAGTWGDDVYYYGMFNPAAGIYQYCGGGCLLGVTLLNNDPPDTGSSNLRLALGVGFDKEAPNTCAHEIGHSHGRGHVNCGYGVDPSSIDPAYPHAATTIGGWSWDITAEPSAALMDPSYTDIMGYCDKQWISDYMYTKLFMRTQNVNIEDFVSTSPIAYDVVGFDGLGSVSWLTDVMRPRPISGRKLPVEARDATGAERTLEGVWVPYDHLPGGWLFLPAGQASELSLAIDGNQLSAKRPL
jgi:hypothetical protein